MEVAQTLILRPDSVLEYSCFDDLASDVSTAADTIFSDNVFSADLFNIPVETYDPPSTDYVAYLPTINATTVTPPNTGQTTALTGPNPPEFPPGRLFSSGLDTAIGLLVFDAMFQYFLSNFSQEYIGGTFATIPSGTVCNPMALVWQFVKCTNFDIDLFRDFDQLVLIDSRQNPIPCNDSSRTTAWTTNFAAAFPAPGAAGGVVPVETFNDRLDSSACSGVIPVKTGVQVYQGAPSSIVFEDAVCPAAGCYYDGAACN